MTAQRRPSQPERHLAPTPSDRGGGLTDTRFTSCPGKRSKTCLKPTRHWPEGLAHSLFTCSLAPGNALAKKKSGRGAENNQRRVRMRVPEAPVRNPSASTFPSVDVSMSPLPVLRGGRREGEEGEKGEELKGRGGHQSSTSMILGLPSVVICSPEAPGSTPESAATQCRLRTRYNESPFEHGFKHTGMRFNCNK